MLPRVTRVFWGAVLLLLGSSCVSIPPLIKKEPAAKLSGFDLVYFVFGKHWPANHVMTEVLQQEFERRHFVILHSEPPPDLWPRTLRLQLDWVDDAWRMKNDRPDHVGQLGFRLEQMTDGKEVGRVSYKGIGLDRIGQRDLAEEIVDGLLRGS